MDPSKPLSHAMLYSFIWRQRERFAGTPHRMQSPRFGHGQPTQSSRLRALSLACTMALSPSWRWACNGLADLHERLIDDPKLRVGVHEGYGGLADTRAGLQSVSALSQAAHRGMSDIERAVPFRKFVSDAARRPRLFQRQYARFRHPTEQEFGRETRAGRRKRLLR